MSRFNKLYDDDDLTPDIIEKAKEELGETEEVKAKTLEELKSLIKTEQDFEPCMEDWFLLRYLRTKKYDVQRSFELLKRYYQFRAANFDSFTGKNLSDVLYVLDEGHAAVLLHRNEDGSAILVIRFGQYDYQRIPIEDILAFPHFIIELALLSEVTQICGYTVIDDAGDITFSDVRKFSSPSLFYKIGHAMQVYVHGNNLNKLYEEIPPEILPEELGGTQGPMSRSFKILKEKLMAHEDYFIKMSKYGYRGETFEKLRKS